LTDPCSAGLISEEQEISIGREGANKLEAQYGTWNDPVQLQRINRIGQGIKVVTERNQLNYSFKILNVDKVNALAFPGGFIYVTRGLLPNVDDQELAFVLGHEIAHVAKRHSIQQMEQQLMTQLGLVTLVALLNRGEVSEGTMNTVQMASLVITSQYSREDEIEADIAACNYMVYGLGYNPRAGINFMKKLKAMSGDEVPGFLNSLVGSHPLADERITAIDAECKKLGY
jgi:predicted Zn-dependent protease